MVLLLLTSTRWQYVNILNIGRVWRLLYLGTFSRLDDRLGIPQKIMATGFEVVCGWSVTPALSTSQLLHATAGQSVVCLLAISLSLTSSPGRMSRHLTWQLHCGALGEGMLIETTQCHSSPVNVSILAIMPGRTSDHGKKFKFNIPTYKSKKNWGTFLPKWYGIVSRVTTLQAMWNSLTIHWRFAALLRGTRHVKCYSHHVCTSVTVSGGARNATVHDLKSYISHLTQNRLLLNTCMDANMQLTINS